MCLYTVTKDVGQCLKKNFLSSFSVLEGSAESIRNKELGVRGEGQPGCIKEAELLFSKSLILHLACEVCCVVCFFFPLCAIVQKPKSFSALLVQQLAIEKKPLLFIFQPLFDLKVSFSPAPLKWLRDMQETFLVLGTDFWIETKAYYQRQIVCQCLNKCRQEKHIFPLRKQ